MYPSIIKNPGSDMDVLAVTKRMLEVKGMLARFYGSKCPISKVSSNTRPAKSSIMKVIYN